MAESSVICKKERSGMEEKVAVSGAEGTTTNKPGALENYWTPEIGTPETGT